MIKFNDRNSTGLAFSITSSGALILAVKLNKATSSDPGKEKKKSKSKGEEKSSKS